MKRLLVLLFLSAAGTLLPAQTIIDLQNGGQVRAKTTEDYNLEAAVARRNEKDSLEYKSCLTQAFNALHADSLAQAESFFKKALKLRPNAPGNHIVRKNLGRICLAREDYAGATDYFTETLKTAPEDDETRYLRAKAYVETGNTKAAFLDCDALLQSTRGTVPEPDLRFLRAAVCLHARLYVDARNELETVLRLDPKRTGAQLLLAVVDDLDGRPQKALERLDLLIQNEPKSVDALALRARLESKQRLYEVARADLDAAIALEANNGALYVQRAEVLLHLGKRPLARQDLDTAVRLGIPRQTLTELYRK